MVSQTTLKSIDKYWSSYLNCSLENLCTQDTFTLLQAGHTDFQGAFLFLRNHFCAMLVPESLTESVELAIRSYKPEEIFNVEFQRKVFGNLISKVIGPACVSYADTTNFTPIDHNDARLLNREDEPSLRYFARSVSELDWEYSGIEIGREPVFGYFVEGNVVAAASYEIWGEKLAHIGVVTHASQRRRGYGKAVVSAITEYVLRQGLIAQYRTLRSNRPSISIAGSLGFREYASTIAITFTENREC